MAYVIDFVASHIHETDAFVVIDRMQRESILREIEFSKADCTDEQCAVEIGKLLSASLIVVGSIGRVGSRYILNMKLVEVETGQTIETASQMYADIDALIDDSEVQTLALLGFVVADVEGSTAGTPPPKTEPAEETREETGAAEAEKTTTATEPADSTDTAVKSAPTPIAIERGPSTDEAAFLQRTYDRLVRIVDTEHYAQWARENEYRSSLNTYDLPMRVEVIREYLDATSRGLSFDIGANLLFNYTASSADGMVGTGVLVGVTRFFGNGISVGLSLIVDVVYCT